MAVTASVLCRPCHKDEAGRMTNLAARANREEEKGSQRPVVRQSLLVSTPFRSVALTSIVACPLLSRSLQSFPIRSFFFRLTGLKIPSNSFFFFFLFSACFLYPPPAPISTFSLSSVAANCAARGYVLPVSTNSNVKFASKQPLNKQLLTK